jgi:DNA-binding GntR family transcriptional regulator
MEKKALRFKTKSQLVYETIKNEITTGLLNPGMRISAVEVAERLGVSRTPVNDAVKILADQGLVKLLPNVGFEIMVLEWDDIRELMYLKCQIEKLMIRLAMERPDTLNLHDLRDIQYKIMTAIEEEDDKAYYDLTKMFHFDFCKLAQGHISFDVYQRLWDYEGWYAACLKNSKEALLAIAADHDRLLDAMESGDFDKAIRIADEHAEVCIQFLYENMKKLGMF